MEAFVCTSCGSNEFINNGSFYTCAYCGTRYKDETSASRASIDKSKRIEDMLRRADMYWSLGKKVQAKAIYRQILELDASCAIARERM